MQEKKRKKGRLLMGMGLLLLAVAFVLALRLIKEEQDADVSAQKVLGLMTESAANAAHTAKPQQSPNVSPEKEIPSEAVPSPVAAFTPEPASSLVIVETPPPAPSPTIAPVPLETPAPALFEINQNIEMPITVIEGHEYIGILDFPVLGLSLPVMSDWDYTKLRIAPCRYKGSAYTGDLIISGHNYERHFGRFPSMLPGDEVRFTDVDGNVFYYVVSACEKLDMRNVKGMLEGDWDMTLFTCVPGGARRETLRCKLERYEVASPDSKTE